MPNKSNTVNWGGLDLVVNRIVTGVTKPITGELAVADAVASGHIVSKRNIDDLTTTPHTLTASQSGSLFLINKADGVVVTLPALSATNVGIWFEFQVNTSITSNSFKLVSGTQGTDFFIGTLPLHVAGTADIEFMAGNGTTHDNITFAGTTTGGLAGTRVKVEAISATQWTVSGIVHASGAPATPFATS